jgi:hypothetical protein
MPYRRIRLHVAGLQTIKMGDLGRTHIGLQTGWAKINAGRFIMALAGRHVTDRMPNAG